METARTLLERLLDLSTMVGDKSTRCEGSVTVVNHAYHGQASDMHASEYKLDRLTSVLVQSSRGMRTMRGVRMAMRRSD